MSDSFLVVSPGQCGSSLFAHLLTLFGADFGGHLEARNQQHSTPSYEDRAFARCCIRKDVTGARRVIDECLEAGRSLKHPAILDSRELCEAAVRHPCMRMVFLWRPLEKLRAAHSLFRPAGRKFSFEARLENMRRMRCLAQEARDFSYDDLIDDTENVVAQLCELVRGEVDDVLVAAAVAAVDPNRRHA